MSDLPPEELCEGDPNLEDEHAAVTPQGHIETGPVQFGEDWPGIFIRGQQALFLAAQLEVVLNAVAHLDPQPMDTIFPEKFLRGLIKDFASCHVACNSVKLLLKPLEDCREKD